MEVVEGLGRVGVVQRLITVWVAMVVVAVVVAIVVVVVVVVAGAWLPILSPAAMPDPFRRSTKGCIK